MKEASPKCLLLSDLSYSLGKKSLSIPCVSLLDWGWQVRAFFFVKRCLLLRRSPAGKSRGTEQSQALVFHGPREEFGLPDCVTRALRVLSRRGSFAAGSLRSRPRRSGHWPSSAPTPPGDRHEGGAERSRQPDASDKTPGSSRRRAAPASAASRARRFSLRRGARSEEGSREERGSERDTEESAVQTRAEERRGAERTAEHSAQ